MADAGFGQHELRAFRRREGAPDKDASEASESGPRDAVPPKRVIKMSGQSACRIFPAAAPAVV